MTTQGTETRQGQDPQGLGAKHDGPFGAADAPQPTDNAETIMTDVQQAVPVVQVVRDIAAIAFGYFNQANMFDTHAHDAEAGRIDSHPLIQVLAAYLSCKSGEGAGEIGDFVMVPRKLTDDMLEAVVKLDFTSTHDPLWPEYWAAMLDAAPTVPDATQTREAELVAALKAQEDAQDARDGCFNCEGEGMWEHCPSCSLTFGRAIDLRRAALGRISA